MSRAGLRMAAVAGVGLLAPAGPAAARAQAQAEVKLEARFPEGQTLRYQIRTTMNQQVKNLGMEMPSNLNRTVVRSEAIGKRRGESGLPIAVKVESIRERQRLPAGLDVSYDSKEGTAKVANPDLDFFKDMYRAFFCAFNASSVARKQCFWVMAVSVLFTISSTNKGPNGKTSLLQSMCTISILLAIYK